jgi:hypothetical protein
MLPRVSGHLSCQTPQPRSDLAYVPPKLHSAFSVRQIQCGGMGSSVDGRGRKPRNGLEYQGGRCVARLFHHPNRPDRSGGHEESQALGHAEPAAITPRTTPRSRRRWKQKSRPLLRVIGVRISGVGPARLERATSCSGGKRSIQLSYGPLSLVQHSRPPDMLPAPIRSLPARRLAAIPRLGRGVRR